MLRPAPAAFLALAQRLNERRPIPCAPLALFNLLRSAPADHWSLAIAGARTSRMPDHLPSPPQPIATAGQVWKPSQTQSNVDGAEKPLYWKIVQGERPTVAPNPNRTPNRNLVFLRES